MLSPLHVILGSTFLSATASNGLDPAVVTSFVREGIMGSVAVLFIGLYLKERAAHDESRRVCAQKVDDVNGKLTSTTQRLHEERIVATNVLTAEYGEQTRELLEQLHSLREANAERERSYQNSIEFFAKSEVEAVEELGRIAETLRRSYGSNRDR